MTWSVIESDCIQYMKTLETNSVDAVVTDPPYGLEFMGKKWDKPYWRRDRSPDKTGRGSWFGDNHDSPRYGGKPHQQQAWHEQWATEALRVLKPGGHLLAFGGTRTYHRMVCAIEDAGFEIRDSIHWMYGSGFPKSLDVSKALDKAAGAEREIVGEGRWNHVKGTKGKSGGITPDGYVSHGGVKTTLTAPAPDLAKQWEGWGTALKPAHEPIVMARKPLTGTVAATVTTWGVGALNVDGCRVPFQGAADRAESEGKNQHTRYANPNSNRDSYSGDFPPRADYDGSRGRWPANVILGCACPGETHEPGCAVALLDAQSGERRSSGVYQPIDHGPNGIPKATDFGSNGIPATMYADTGGASRFFYQAKASRRERTCDGTVECSHPTVKPIALMRYLCRLVTPPGGLVLDPFCGSGTTGIACVQEGFNFLGIEQDASYCDTARQRISHWSSS